MSSSLLTTLKSAFASVRGKQEGSSETKMGSHPESQPDWANLKVLHRNTLPPRSNFVLYDNEKDALSRDVSKAKVHCLSGDWRFHLSDSPFNAPSGFEAATFDSSKWSKIKVPGMWQMQGFGNGPHYTNVMFPFHVDPPTPPYTNNECGSHITEFKVPKQLQNHQLRLRFEGVDSAFHVWVNGHEVGYSQGSRNPSEFDITELLNTGQQNTLAVRVYQFCDGSYIEDQDQWWLSGIFRDVHLIAFPKTAHFEDVAATTTFDDGYVDATLKVHAELSGSATVKLKLVDADGKEVKTASQSSREDGLCSVDFEMSIEKPNHWTAETPYLYSMVLSIDDEQFMAQRIGFRQVEIKDGLIKVNGRRVVFKGANRHEHHPESGRTVPYEFLKHDLLLMKQYNINSIRTCHQPNDPRLYDLADEFGFWIMDEADLECHGFETVADAALPVDQRDLLYPERQKLTGASAASWTSDNPEWRDAYVDRAKQMVHRDKLHPSVVMWSLGNEAFYGRNHTTMVEWIKSYDPTRPIHYEPDQDAQHVDMYSRMYPSILQILGLGNNDCVERKKPLVLCEYIHAMGTGPGNIKEYIECFYEVPQIQGGWVWEWANHGLLTKTKDGTPYYSYGGDFGDVPNDSNFVMDGVLQSDHTPNSGLVEYGKALEPVQVLDLSASKATIINRLDFATLDHLTCHWSLVDEEGLTQGADGSFDLPSGVQPGHTADLALPAVKTELAGEAHMLLSFRLKTKTLWADAGHEVAWAQVPLASNDRVTSLPTSTSSPLKVTKAGGKLTIVGKQCRWAVDLVKGLLIGWQKDGKDILAQPLMPSFYRALTDNDAPHDGKAWKESFLHLASVQCRAAKWHEEGGNVVVLMEQKFGSPVLSWSLDLSLTYTFGTDGSLRVHVVGKPSGLNLPSTLPRIGMTLGLHKDLQRVEWFGRGPDECYKDMKLSQKVGRHAVQSVGALWSSPEFPQECSNRTDTRWLKLSDKYRKTSLDAQFFNPADPNKRKMFDFMASHFDVKDIDEARHPYELEQKAQDAIALRLDAEHHGLGTGSCGPRTLETYALYTEPFEFGILLY